MNVRLVAYESSLVIFFSGGALTSGPAKRATAVDTFAKTLVFLAEVVLLLPDACTRLCVARCLDTRFL